MCFWRENSVSGAQWGDGEVWCLRECVALFSLAKLLILPAGAYVWRKPYCCKPREGYGLEIPYNYFLSVKFTFEMEHSALHKCSSQALSMSFIGGAFLLEYHLVLNDCRYPEFRGCLLFGSSKHLWK